MKLFSAVFTAFLLSAFALPAHAQTPRLGHLNYQKVLESMPGYKDAEKQVQDLVMQLQQQLEKMQEELNKLIADYTANEKIWSEPIKEVKLQEIKDLEARIMQLRYTSEEKVMQKQVEVLKPLEDKILAAVRNVAVEKGFAYIFESGPGTSLLHYPPADDITDLIKAKLAIP